MYDPELGDRIATRTAFEFLLDGMSGLEYRVHLSPASFGPEVEPNLGTFVIRKQERRWVDGDPQNAELTVLATYYVVGLVVYMANSISDVITSRLVSPFEEPLAVASLTAKRTTTSSLSKLMQRASSLSMYSPSEGHHYIPANVRQQDRPSRTPGNSREGSLAPEGSQISTTSKSLKSKGGDVGTLYDAYRLFNSFSNEYMDENPLLGEPGSFVFSTSREAVQGQRDAEAKRAEQQAELKKAQEHARKEATTVKAQSAPPPKEEITLLKPVSGPTPSRKSSRAPDGEASGGRKPKRRKSKAPGTPAAASA